MRRAYWIAKECFQWLIMAMFFGWLVVIFMLSLYTALARADDVLIRNDGGGLLTAYEANARVWSAHNTHIVIDGFCASSCNILLQQRWNLDVCATDTAILQFHMPYKLMVKASEPDTVYILTGTEMEQLSLFNWVVDWAEAFSPQLNNILQYATMRGVIPNPSISGDTTTMFNVPAQLVLPACEHQSVFNMTQEHDDNGYESQD